MVTSQARRSSGTFSLAQTLIEGKLKPPRQSVSVIERPELLEQLDAGLDKHLTLIQASAGFGKTTLAEQWRSRQLARGTRVAWLTLQEDDSEVIQFLAYVVASLSRAGVDMRELEGIAGKAFIEVPIKSAFTSMVAALTADPVKTILILDDYHRVQSTDIDHLLDTLIALMPGNLHLLISTRDRPNLSLADLRSHGDLNELTFSDLQFSLNEIRMLMPETSGDENLAALRDRTEGWAAAIQLARIYMTNPSNAPNFVERFSGRTGDVADYLAEQVLAGLSADLQDFLMKISILENFNGHLANAICARSDSWEFIDQLAVISSLLMPIDEDRTWFRFHHLFRDFLRQRLDQRYGLEIQKLHLRSSQWYDENGMLLEAVRHARLGGDETLAARLIELSGGWRLLISEGSGVVRNLLKQFDADLSKFPRLELCRVLLMAKTGEIIEARSAYEEIRKATANFQGELNRPNNELLRDGEIVGLALDCYDDSIVTSSGLKRLNKLRESIPQNDYYSHGSIQSAAAIAGIGRGDFAATTKFAQISLKDMEFAGSPLGHAFSYLHYGMASMFQGEMKKAEKHYQTGLEIAQQHFGSDSGPKAIADVLIAEVHFQKNDLEKASECLHNSLRHVVEYDGWVDIYATGYLTAIGMACTFNNYQDAFTLIREGQETADTRGLKRLSGLLAAARYRVTVASGNFREAERIRENEFAFDSALLRRTPEYWRQYYSWGIAAAEHDIALGRPGPAIDVLADLERCCRSIGAKYYLIETLFLHAIALQAQGKLDSSVHQLLPALELAAPQRILRIFLDRGDVFGCLVDEGLAHAADDFEERMVLDFARELQATLKVFQNDQVGPISRSITDREMQILIQLGRGYSNKAIARTLGITENTVKFHLKNIYSKLGVAKRRQAIELARGHSIIR